MPESWSSAKAIRHISFCLSIASSLPPSAPGSLRDFLTDPLFEVLRAKVQVGVEVEVEASDDDDDDEDVDEESVNDDALCHHFNA